MNKLHSTNEFEINLPNDLGPVGSFAVVTPESEEHQGQLLGTGWFRVGDEVTLKAAKAERLESEAAAAEAEAEKAAAEKAAAEATEQAAILAQATLSKAIVKK